MSRSTTHMVTPTIDQIIIVKGKISTKIRKPIVYYEIFRARDNIHVLDVTIQNFLPST